MVDAVIFHITVLHIVFVITDRFLFFESEWVIVSVVVAQVSSRDKLVA
jgi:hypothetical protein